MRGKNEIREQHTMSGITTHILDTSRGRPASGVEVRLLRSNGDGWKEVGPREEARLREDGGDDSERSGSPSLSDLYARRYMETPGRFARRPRAWLWALRNLGQARRASANGAGAQAFTANPFRSEERRVGKECRL